MTRQHFQFGRILLILLYLALAVTYGVVNPAFESPDELYHFDYVEELLRTGKLPVAGAAQNEFHQPPLYYAAGALLTVWLSPGDAVPQMIERNPYWPWRIGEVGVDNKSQFVHGPEQRFPYTGPWLRLHLLRLFSTLLGAWTVWLTGSLALALWPRQSAVALLAMAFVGFLPQFLFLSSSVTNDVAAVVLSALIMLALARFLHTTQMMGNAQQPTETHPYRRALWLGLLLGLAVLAKVNSLLLVLPLAAVLVGAGLVDRPSPGARYWRGLVLVFGTAVAVAAPLLWRNWRLYGDPTALRPMDLVWGRRDPPLPLGDTLREIPNIWSSFWARFGYGQIPVPPWMYAAAAGLVLVAGVGLYLAWRERRPLRARLGSRFWLLVYALLLIAIFTAAVLRYTQTSFNGNFGRFVFPALPAIAVLLAFGWTAALAQIRLPARGTMLGAAGLLVMLNVWILTAVLQPAYVMPVSAPASVSGDLASAPGLHMGDVAVLRRATLLTPSLTPGGDAAVEVTWLPLRQTAKPLTVFIWLVGPDGESLGTRHTYPGLGRLTTASWQVGQPLRDVYRVPVDEAAARAAAPARVGVYVGLYDRSTDQILTVTDVGTNQVVWQPVAEAKLPLHGEPAAGPLASFDDSLLLEAVTLPAAAAPGTTVPVSLTWTVMQPVTASTKLFLHLVSQDDLTPLTQVDETILADRYPPRLWSAGDRLPDHHTLPIPPDLPPGTYRVVAGLYQDKPGWPRLHVHAARGATNENSLILGTIEIRP